jgi:Ras GTPase-activating-like protein IQGAP2/3
MRQSKRYSFTALYLSMSAKEKDLEIEDDLAKGRLPYKFVRRVPAPCICPMSPIYSTDELQIAQKVLRELKAKISSQSKKNFVLEKDVRYLDSRIALLIQNRMALEEVRLKRCSPVDG